MAHVAGERRLAKQETSGSGIGLGPPGSNAGAGQPADPSYRPSWDEIAHFDSQKGTLTDANRAVTGFAAPGGLPGGFGSGPIGPAGTPDPNHPGGNPFTQGRDPAILGREWIADFIKNGGSEDRLRQLLENTELAYNTAGAKARGITYGSGAGEGGVARMQRGNIEMSRGADQARNLREANQFNDQQIASLIDMYYKHYNNAYAIAQGGAQIPNQGSSGADAFQQAFQLALTYGAASCWVARSIYGIEDPRWLVARHYVLHNAPGVFRRFYLRHGKKIAGWLDSHAWAKRFVKPLFDWMVRKATFGG